MKRRWETAGKEWSQYLKPGSFTLHCVFYHGSTVLSVWDLCDWLTALGCTEQWLKHPFSFWNPYQLLMGLGWREQEIRKAGNIHGANFDTCLPSPFPETTPSRQWFNFHVHQNLVQIHIAGPHTELLTQLVWARSREIGLLTNSQVILLVPKPHLENDWHRALQGSTED